MKNLSQYRNIKQQYAEDAREKFLNNIERQATYLSAQALRIANTVKEYRDSNEQSNRFASLINDFENIMRNLNFAQMSRDITETVRYETEVKLIDQINEMKE